MTSKRERSRYPGGCGFATIEFEHYVLSSGFIILKQTQTRGDDLTLEGPLFLGLKEAYDDRAAR